MQSLNTKQWKLFGLQITQTRHPLKAFPLEKCMKPMSKVKVHKMRGAHLQNVSNHYAKFEQKGIKTFGVTDCTN